jgi:hypothetical protein
MKFFKICLHQKLVTSKLLCAYFGINLVSLPNCLLSGVRQDSEGIIVRSASMNVRLALATIMPLAVTASTRISANAN